MKDKTTKELFTKEFLDNLKFLIEHINIEEDFQETIQSRPTFEYPYHYICDEELEELAEKFNDLFAEVTQQINDYFNTDFTELSAFLDENQGTSYYDLEAELIEHLERYMS
jgi:hypothetical protein